PGVDRHVASVAETVAADVVAEGLGVVLAVGHDRPFGLPARFTAFWRPPAPGGVLAHQPAVRLHPLVMVEAVVDFEGHDRIYIFAFHLFDAMTASAQCLFQCIMFLIATCPSARKAQV